MTTISLKEIFQDFGIFIQNLWDASGNSIILLLGSVLIVVWLSAFFGFIAFAIRSVLGANK